MKIFLDRQYQRNRKMALLWYVDGVTTNPPIMLKDGIYNIEEGLKNWPNDHAAPLSAEVTTNDLKEMVEQAKWLASLAHMSSSKYR